jgi:hypothetical protein
MRNLLTSIFTIVLFVIPQLYAQIQIDDGSESPLQTQERGTNMISCTAYEAIKYNGHTIVEIQNTDGKSAEIQQLFGSYTSTEEI